MRTDLKMRLVALLMPLALTACAGTQDHVTPYLGGPTNFGEANRMTMAAQVIDPDPAYATPTGSSGDHAAQAIDRYLHDKVKKPDNPRSPKFGGGQSGGQGGGSGN